MKKNKINPHIRVKDMQFVTYIKDSRKRCYTPLPDQDEIYEKLINEINSFWLFVNSWGVNFKN